MMKVAPKQNPDDERSSFSIALELEPLMLEMHFLWEIDCESLPANWIEYPSRCQMSTHDNPLRRGWGVFDGGEYNPYGR